MAEKTQRFCPKCGRTMNSTEFYKSNNKEKYPEGYLNECKKCITMHVDNWEPSTFLPILQEADVPWVPEEWNKIMYKYKDNPEKITGMTILGRYLAKMRIIQFKDYRWKDTDYLAETAKAKIKQAMQAQGYSASEIDSTIEKNFVEPLEKPAVLSSPDPEIESTPVFAPPQEATAEDLGLTEEDITYLKLKWGKMYRPEEWVRLEQLYNEMLESYDIQTAGHIDTLKLLCKTSLKCNQLIDINDVEGYQKMSKVYDNLMKSGNFTAAQNKQDKGEFVDSIGELVMLCEKDGYIERYYIEDPQDKVDETLQDMKRYTHNLVSEETNLNQLLEAAIKMNMKEDEDADKNNEEDIVFDDAISEVEAELKDNDFADFRDFVEEDAMADEELLKSLAKEDYV